MPTPEDEPTDDPTSDVPHDALSDQALDELLSHAPPEFSIEPIGEAGPKKRFRLDESKRREILAILTVGGTRANAAEYVGCHPNTIRRHAARDPEFARALRRARTTHEVMYLRSINAAAGDMRYWRAAAWALEHLYPERYAKRKPGAFGGDQLRLVLNYFVSTIRKEIPNDDLRQRIRQRIERIVARLERAGGEDD